MEDGQIIELYLQRNEKALEEAQNKYGSYCFRIAKNILTVWEDAEEKKEIEELINNWLGQLPKEDRVLFIKSMSFIYLLMT